MILPPRETNGESVLVETIVRPDGFVAAAHVHPDQTERFEVLEGLVGLRIGKKEIVVRQQPHSNGGDPQPPGRRGRAPAM